MTFHVGQKVVCVKRDAWRFWHDKTVVNELTPNYGEAVTVSYIETEFGLLWLRFEEYSVGRWDARRFRPIVERKTSIELLTSIRPDTPIVGPEIERELFKQKERT